MNTLCGIRSSLPAISFPKIIGDEAHSPVDRKKSLITGARFRLSGYRSLSVIKQSSTLESELIHLDLEKVDRVRVGISAYAKVE